MAFTYTQTDTVQTVWDGKIMTWGTFTSAAGSTGGNINTGLKNVDTMLLQYKAAAVVADAPVTNETLPIAGSAVTIITTANAVGYWVAIGRQ